MISNKIKELKATADRENSAQELPRYENLWTSVYSEVFSSFWYAT